MGKIIATLILGFVLFGAVYYYYGPTFDSNILPGKGQQKTVINIDQLGKALYEPAAFPKVERDEHKRDREPVAIYGYLSAMEQVELPSPVPGQILFVGEEISEGAVQAAGVASFMAEPCYYTSIFMGKNKVPVLYKRFYEGQTVTQDQVVLVVDYSKALGVILEKKAKVLAANADRDSAKKAADEGRARYERVMKLRPNVAEEEVAEKLLTWEKLTFDHLNKIEAVHVAEEDLNQAFIVGQQHKVRNKLGYNKTFIRSILRPRGAAVKELEPVMQLQAIDRLLAEANIEFQYLDRIREKKFATIEPSQEESPARPLQGHLGNVTCVAISKDHNNPLIVSGSEDKTVCVWNRFSSSPLRVFHHNESVQSIACTLPGSERNLCISGCADGSIYLWDLNSESPEKLISLAHDDRHEAVTSVAFSPDGKYFASGSADGSIRLWSTNEGKDAKILYPFDAKFGVENPHRGAITTLSFLPQSVLVSAGRDNTLRVWKLLEKGAVLQYNPISGRDGKVAQIGVSRSGQDMIFDQGRSLQLLSVEKGEPLTTLTSPGSSTPFETLAIFSPDRSLMMTAGAPEGRIQLWHAPNINERAFEVRQFITQERWPVSCAAFSPAAGEGGDNSFAVSASKQILYVWPVPGKNDIKNHRIENVPLRLISQSLDTSTRMLRIGFEVANQDGLLLPGRPVTIVID